MLSSSIEQALSCVIIIVIVFHLPPYLYGLLISCTLCSSRYDRIRAKGSLRAQIIPRLITYPIKLGPYVTSIDCQVEKKRVLEKEKVMTEDAEVQKEVDEAEGEVEREVLQNGNGHMLRG